MLLLVVPIGVFVPRCKLLWKEARLGDPITRVLQSPNTFSVGVETMPRGRKHGAQSWTSMGSLFTDVRVDEGASGGPGLEADAGGGRARSHTGRPTAPTKAQEGPLVETPVNSPASGVLPPRPGLLPVTPHISGQFSGPKTLNRNHQPPSSSLQHLTFPWDKNVLGPSREELVENQLPRPHEELSSSRDGPKIPFPLLFSSLHRDDTHVFFLIECVKTL